ncbi:hypothetical protein [Methylobacter svalbardensis]|uniref:hypothetical protein n=1 Tax=Methylobacter svalbardensis TaxID=3080016 RepID=UPI0030EE7EB7
MEIEKWTGAKPKINCRQITLHIRMPVYFLDFVCKADFSMIASSAAHGSPSDGKVSVALQPLPSVQMHPITNSVIVDCKDSACRATNE